MRSQNMICPGRHSSRFSQKTKSRVKEASQKAVSGGYCQETKHTTATCNMWWSKHVGPGIWPLKVLPGHRPSVLVDAERLTWDTMIHGPSCTDSLQEAHTLSIPTYFDSMLLTAWIAMMLPRQLVALPL